MKQEKIDMMQKVMDLMQEKIDALEGRQAQVWYIANDESSAT